MHVYLLFLKVGPFFILYNKYFKLKKKKNEIKIFSDNILLYSLIYNLSIFQN